LTPGTHTVPGMDAVLEVVDETLLRCPPSPFIAMHAAIALCAAEDGAGLATLARSCERRTDQVHVEVAAPLARALGKLVQGKPSEAADDLAALQPTLWRVGGSDAQREVVEETRICALLRAGRYDDALVVIDRRLDRRHCRRDESMRWVTRAEAQLAIS